VRGERPFAAEVEQENRPGPMPAKVCRQNVPERLLFVDGLARAGRPIGLSLAEAFGDFRLHVPRHEFATFVVFPENEIRAPGQSGS
jgi:hypothetical protein